MIIGTPQNNLPTSQDYLNYFQGGAEPSDIKDLSTAPGPEDMAGQVSAGTDQVSGQGQAAQPGTTYTGAATAAPGQTGSVRERLFGGFNTGFPEANQKLAGLSSAFREQAGPSRSFESAGGQGAFEGSFGPGSTEEARNRAKGLAGASYSGPTGLSADETAALKDQIQRLLGSSQALQSGAGAYGLIRQSDPSLGQAQAQYEAQHIIGDPGLAGQARGFEAQSRGLLGEVDAAQQGAQQYAQQRQGEEAAIRQQSRDYLGHLRSGVEDPITARITSEENRQKAMEDAYQGFLRQGTFADTSLFPGAEKFKTSGLQQSQEAQRQWDEILARYPDIAQIPLMQLGRNDHGREQLQLPDEYMKANGGKVTTDMLTQAQARQQELERYFSPGTKSSSQGQFAQYKPLYFGGDENLMDTEVPTWQPQNIGAYFRGFDPGTAPTEANMATADERSKINHLNEILGDKGHLATDDQPFRQAQIAADTDQFISDEISTLEARKGELTDKSQAYLKELRKARKHYKKLKNERSWGRVVNVFQQVMAPGSHGSVLDKVLPKASTVSFLSSAEPGPNG